VRRLGIDVVALAVLFWAGEASAASVILVAPPSPSPAMAEAIVRVRGELIAEGFQVQVMDGLTGGESHGSLEELAKMRRADAVVAIVGEETPDSVEVWVVDATEKTVVRRIPFQPQPDQPPKTFAIHTLELLRGSLLELDLRPADRPSEVKSVVPAPVSERPASRSGRFGVEVGAAALIGSGDVGPAILPVIRLGWAPRPALIAQVALAGYGSHASVDSDLASAWVAEEFAVLGACYRFMLGRGLRPSLSLAAGVLHTRAEGQSDSLSRGQKASLWSFMLDGGVGIGLVLADRFEVDVAAHAQIADPYPAIRFDRAIVATSNHPSLLLTLTVGAWL